MRKLETAVQEFKTALQEDDLVAAQQLLRSIAQTSDYLADDVTSIYKSEITSTTGVGPNDMYAGGAPVIQFKKSGGVIDGDRPLGYIGPDGITGRFRSQNSATHQE